MRSLTLGSLFSGSGGFELAGQLAGIKPIWNCEVEPFAVAVTQKNFPDVKHYGDINDMNGGEVETVDVITFGSPCQDMSIAGKRSGLGGERSSLFYEAVRIIKEMRCATNGRYPRYIVWENVPGAFSSNGGEDFRCVLEEICKVKDEHISVPESPGRWSPAGEIVGDGFSVAWRTLDAQHWGVPQRRKRIYLVADFDGECAGKILFESEGVHRNSAPGVSSRQGTATSTESGVGETSVCLNDLGGSQIDLSEDVSPTLRAQDHGHPPCVMSAGFCTEHSAKSRSIGYEEEKSPTLRADVVPAALQLYENHSQDTRYTGPLDTAPTVNATYGMGGNNQPFALENTPKTLKIRCGREGGGKGALIQDNLSATLDCNNDQTLFEPKAYGISPFASNAMLSDNPRAGIYEAETSRTLDCSGGDPSCNQGGVAIVEKTYAIQGNMIGRSDKNGPQGCGVAEDVSYTLTDVDRHAVYAVTTGKFTTVSEGLSPTLAARDYKDPTAVAPVPSGEPLYTVRRLTPTECARLQGFPDCWAKDLGNPDPSDEELAFWTEVWETHRKVVTHASKPKTEKQVRKWLADPHTDSAEYRLWGNAIALPCAHFVLEEIAACANWLL